jgi:membrane associated rhomboid family serine protease
MVCFEDCSKKRSYQLQLLFPAIFLIYFITEVMQAYLFVDAFGPISHASHFSGLLGGILLQLFTRLLEIFTENFTIKKSDCSSFFIDC